MGHLTRVLGFALLLLAIAAWEAPEAIAQKKKAEAKKNKDSAELATPADYKLIQKNKEIAGSIVSISESIVTIKVDVPHMENNPKGPDCFCPRRGGLPFPCRYIS